ncbi:MAG: hypothetical protein JXA71_01335 [Chitinispirillaceae bacterium]|nr:hypothetical protein [Chitinispirillaceae bacterium]
MPVAANRTIVPKVVFLLLSAVLATAVSQTSPHQEIRITRDWKFYRGDISGADAVSFSDNSWETVCLPHTVRVENVGFTPQTNYLGYCWYRKSFASQPSWQDKKVVFRFEGAMQKAEVWINGTKKITYLGGYTPFSIDITPHLSWTQNNVAAVRLDNRADNTFPVGYVPTTFNGTYALPDLSYFGGLYRDVTAIVTDKLHISDPLLANIAGGGGVFITTPTVSSSNASVQVKTHVQNEYSDSRTVSLTSTILSNDGQTVQTSTATQTIAAGAGYTFTQAMNVSSPRLWHPYSPNLYVMKSAVSDGTRNADEISTTFGIRSISFTRSGGFSINGQRMVFRGANRHQEYPYVGNAVPLSGQYRDALKMKEGGMDFVRLSHYMQPQSFLDACDRLGLMAMNCVPGWQYFNKTAAFRDNGITQLRSMMRYQRNHPSIILWEVIPNESYVDTIWSRPFQTAAHQELPAGLFYTCGEEANWGAGGVLEVYMSSTQHEVRTRSGSPRPCVISEYGDWEYGGWTGTSRVSRSAGEASLLRAVANHIEAYGWTRQDCSSWLTGDAVWSMYDYQGAQSPLASGVADLFRIPKFSYFFFKSQQRPDLAIPGLTLGPMVHIASFWNAQSSLSVKVFSNCDQVSLYLNNALIATRSPDNAGYARSCEHPPFTFALSGFQQGLLRADGLIGNLVRATHTVRTPGAARAVQVAIDTASRLLVADGSDFALAYASIVDDSSTVLPSASNAVTFSVTGQGRLLGTNPVAAVAGIASILVQATQTPGPITVSAQASGLATGSAGLSSVGEPVTSTLSPEVIERRVSKQPEMVSWSLHKGRVTIMPHWDRMAPGTTIQIAMFSFSGRLIARSTIAGEKERAVSIDARSLKGLFCRHTKIGDPLLGTAAEETGIIGIVE